ncbi:MAG: DUF4982 domain-containing protein [Clostridia bacterium]|nr:DUF4982 domain-containing protein [Clostridia bacterium]
MRQLLNDGWEFARLPSGSTAEDAACAGWRAVDLPHDWLIWQQDLYESADAWYRRVLRAKPKPGECWQLSFDGVYMDCEVLVNGAPAASHAYGYTAFRVPLNGLLRPGDNLIQVHIRHRSPNSRWYSGSGIYRDVYLEVLPEQHIVPDSWIVEDRDEDGGRRVTLQAETAGADGVLLEASLCAPDGAQAAAGSGRSRDHRVSVTLLVPDVEKWDPDHPFLYRLDWRYGEDQGEKRLGFRDLRFDPDQGFFINGRHLKLHGVCLHHDLGALGAAFHEKAARRQLELMQRMGVNALRTSHNPPAEKLLDLCDRMGILVIDEFLDMWERSKTTYDYARFFDRDEEADVAAWVRRDRCHASVILWSIGNEIYDMHADLRGTEVTRMLTEQVRAQDPARHAEVTFGCNYMPWEGGQRCADVVKIPGYNYGEKYYEEHHRLHPDWVIYGSETASVLSSRGIYHFPIHCSIMSEADLQCSALGNSNTSWGAADLRKMIIQDEQTPFSMGQFIWSGIDYIGEPTPYHTRSCYFGQADTACFPKDSFYLFQSLWTKEPMIHIGVTWDWNPGQWIDVPVMTNCAEAELFLNGKSLGRRAVNPDSVEECRPLWRLAFEPGELTARGYDAQGRLLAEDRQATPGNTSRLVLRSENTCLKSDGWDLAFVEISAEDEAGRPVHNARDQVRVTVEGGGRLVGLDNGDSTDPDPYKTDTRRLFGGRLLAIVASNGRKCDTVLRVESLSCAGASLTLPCEEADLLPGCSCRDQVPADSRPLTVRALRKLTLIPLEDRVLTPEHRSCRIRFEAMPADIAPDAITWQVTNPLGILTPYASVSAEDGCVLVRAEGDGDYYLRALCGNAEDHPEIISQIEITARGLGSPAIDPYEPVSAGLFDLQDGEIATGNEKGISFARDGESMAGFSRVDFGPTGSDELVLPIFALNGDRYEIELFDGDPRCGGRLIDTLIYQKPSIWNTYQEETYHLPEILRGLHTLCFRMREKVHLKGFRFIRMLRGDQWLAAGEADEVYGDEFTRSGSSVVGIGNNVTLVFRDMDFGTCQDRLLTIAGQTPLEKTTISVRLTDAQGETRSELAEFRGTEKGKQSFAMSVPSGLCQVSFVFLPGSRFDFDGFRFDPRG